MEVHARLGVWRLLAYDGPALLDGLLDPQDGRRVRAFGGELGGRGLDDRARLGDAGKGHAAELDHRRDRLRHLIDVRIAHERAAARSDLHVNEATRLEHAKRIANGDARHTEPLGELALRLQAIAGLELAIEDRALDLRDDLAGRAGLPDRREGDAAHAVAAAFCFGADASSR